MLLLTSGRHNDKAVFQIACAGFFIGMICFLVCYLCLHTSVLSLPDSFWRTFWQAKPSWISALICFAVMLLMVMMNTGCSLGSWLIGIFFVLQGLVFAFSVSVICGISSVNGIYMALFSAVLPMLLFMFAQLVCLSVDLPGRVRLSACLLGSLCCFGVRCAGMAFAGKLFFG